MNEPEELRKVRLQVAEITGVINYCLGRNEMLPAMMLLYAALDGAAWLWCPEGSEGKYGDNFRDWVRIYLLKPTNKVRPEDLWAARCGILHTQGPESNLWRRNEARQIWYQVKDGSARAVLALNSPTLPLFINPVNLTTKFERGFARFLNDVKADPDRLTRFSRRASTLFDYVRLFPENLTS
jgi:hypothetical protein